MQLNSSNLGRANLQQQIHSWLIRINRKPQSILTQHIDYNSFGNKLKSNRNLLDQITPIKRKLPNSSVQMDW